MEHTRGWWRRARIVGLALLVVCTFAFDAGAQDAVDDAAGREYFERGRVAFEGADYEAALIYFRHAYRLSRRGELQYNIGVAADRLQREEEALEAFEHYLRETDSPTRANEARERIAVLRESIEERKATERALQEATLQMQASNTHNVDGRKLPTSTIAGASTLAAVGAAGIGAMAAGLARNGRCTQEIAGTCVTEESTTAWTWVYGALGVASLAGSATWFAISARRQKRKTQVSIGPLGVRVSGTF